MTTMQDINTIESYEDASEQDTHDALQRMINSGTAWKLQGSYGRAMMDALNAGYCVLGTAPATDYWNNRIPSRDEVKAGTKGSVDYVAQRFGQEYADRMAAL